MLSPLFCLLAAAAVVVAKSPPNCCSLTSFYRLASTTNAQMIPDIEEPPVSAPADACPILNGFPGQPVCLETIAGIVPATPAMLAANARCPYLSPANFSIIQDRFECAGYVTLDSPAFSCTGSFSPFCKYARINDFVPDAEASSICAVHDQFELGCNDSAFAPASACPPFTTFNGKAYPLSAAICLSTFNSTFTSSYASLLSQFSCGAGLAPIIVNQQAGCYAFFSGDVPACALTFGPLTPATCYYAVPKPDSY